MGAGDNNDSEIIYWVRLFIKGTACNLFIIIITDVTAVAAYTTVTTDTTSISTSRRKHKRNRPDYVSTCITTPGVLSLFQEQFPDINTNVDASLPAFHLQVSLLYIS